MLHHPHDCQSTGFISSRLNPVSALHLRSIRSIRAYPFVAGCSPAVPTAPVRRGPGCLPRRVGGGVAAVRQQQGSHRDLLRIIQKLLQRSIIHVQRQQGSILLSY